MQLHLLHTTQYILGTLDDGLGCFPLVQATYLTWTDSYDYTHGIRSLTSVGTPVGAREKSVLYPRVLLHKASPKAISKRTSYHWV